MPDFEETLAAARERLTAPRVGKSITREMDKDILVIQHLGPRRRHFYRECGDLPNRFPQIGR